MNKNNYYYTISILLLTSFYCLIIGCSAIKPSITNQYNLGSFSSQPVKQHTTSLSILVNKPEAVAGYETEQMLYMEKPYELGVFANNAWTSPPADMLFPLILQSLQSSRYFYAVASTSSAESTDYRLDTQLLRLQQNFLHKPSTIDFAAKIVLTQVNTNHVLASRIIQKQIPCPSDTPYGGVIAANQATKQFTAELTSFVVNTIAH